MCVMSERTNQPSQTNLLAAAEALLAAKDNQMETAVEWRALRKAVRSARRATKRLKQRRSKATD
jgi:hypothetical protein